VPYIHGSCCPCGVLHHTVQRDAYNIYIIGDKIERYTVEKKAEIVLLHAPGLSQKHAAEEFHRLHLNRPRPGQRCVGPIYLRLQETGSVSDRPRTAYPRSSTDDDSSIVVRVKIAVNSQRTVRKFASEMKPNSKDTCTPNHVTRKISSAQGIFCTSITWR
jgi:hypothetical protein